MDLGNKQAKIVHLNSEFYKKFLGGSGLAARLLFGKIKSSLSPFHAEAPLLFLTGPFTGTGLPCSGKCSVTSKSPLTHIWAESSVGGKFASYLKFIGFSGIFITGKPSSAVMLKITEKGSEILDATEYWGLGALDVQNEILRDLSLKNASVASIGPAGENLVKFASIIVDGGRAAGRTGLGAVMGSKKLKAIIIPKPEKKPIKPEIKPIIKKFVTEIRNNPSSDILRKYGTSWLVEVAQELGDMPNKYFLQGKFESELISKDALRKLVVGSKACFYCPIACGKIVKLKKNGKFILIDAPEYETICGFGSLFLNQNLEKIVHANYLCNQMGLDTISCSSVIAFATYLFETGKISKSETGGVTLKWGDIDTVLALITQIAYRKGFGDSLAEGTSNLQLRHGLQKFAAEVKGLEVPFHDPRAFFGMALCYATSPRGACHLQGDMHKVDMGKEIPEIGIYPGERFSEKGKAETTVKTQNWMSIYNSLILCQFCVISPKLITEALNCLMGWRITVQDLLLIGERIFNLKRLLNNKLGINARDDYLPSIFLKPLREGGAKNKVPDVNFMLRKYYKIRNWDRITGKPSTEKLKSLKLSSLNNLLI